MSTIIFERQTVKKLFRKILTTCCAMILSLVLLSGCSWAQIDNERYYNQLIATVGDMEFNKKDLLDAFNNYGYQYYQNYGYDMEAAINETINSMIDRALLLEEVKKQVVITPEEDLELRKSAFEYMQNTIFDYEEKVRKEWDMEIKTEEPEEETSLRVAEEEYTPKTVYENGVVKILAEEEDEEIFVGDITKDTHFTKDMAIVTDTRVSNEAWTRYIKALQDAAKSEGRDNKESAVLLYEEERLIEQLRDNKYLEKFKNEYKAKMPVDVSQILDSYRSKFIAEKAAYTADESLYHEAMKEASTNFVYYHPNSGNEYVNVKHILVKFDDAQTAEIATLKLQYGIKDDESVNEKNPDYAEYKARVDEIAKRTTSTFEKDGETYTWTINQVYNYVKSYVTGSHKERSVKFNELIYVFNDDDGMMNSEFDYVVNLDTEVTDQMVKPFADGVRALDVSNGGEGAGSMDMILSEYGYHIIFHDGNAKNLVNEENINSISDADLLEILCTTTTTPDSNKTIFNYLYDNGGTIDADKAYNNMTAELVQDLRNDLKQNDIVIKIYVKNYEDLLEQ